MSIRRPHRVPRRLLSTIAGLVVATCIAPPARADVQIATWLGGDGSWFDPTKWDIGTVPDDTTATTYDVRIDGGNLASASAVSFSTGTATIGGLTLDADDRLDVAAFASRPLILNGPLVVHGSLVAQGIVLPPDATIGGTGTLVGGSEYAPLRTAGGSLTIDAGLTVHGGVPDSVKYYFGGPTIGTAATVTRFVNRGRIAVAGHPARLSSLRIAAGSFSNDGAIELGENGRLILDASFTPASLGTIDATGGELVVGDGATFDLGGGAYAIGRERLVLLGGTVRNGTLRAADAAGRGVVVPYSRVATLDDVTLDHVTLVLDGGIAVRNGLHGNGTITFRNPEAIEGLGIVEIGTVEPGITIRGSVATKFAAGVAKVVLTINDGVIRAERGSFFDAGVLTLSGETITNRGRLELADGARLAAFGAIPLYAGPDPAYTTTLRFADGGTLVVDVGGGLLAVNGDLDLASSLDALRVSPNADGSAYADVTIATYAGTLAGRFDSVTPGIVVSYGNGRIGISGTPVPEPALAASAVAIVMFVVRRRRA